MNLFDDLRSRMNERQIEFGTIGGSIRAGAAFALAFADEMNEEVGRIKKGSPRDDEEILSDSLRRAEREFGIYMRTFENEIGIINKASVATAIREHDAQQRTFWRLWVTPLLQGVASNFLWLLGCGLILAIAFMIKADWPSVVRTWFVG